MDMKAREDERSSESSSKQEPEYDDQEQSDMTNPQRIPTKKHKEPPVKATASTNKNLSVTVKGIKVSLEKEVEKGEGLSVETCKEMLEQLDKCTMTLRILTKSLIGTVVSKLKKNDELGPIAKGLAKKWKNVAKEAEATKSAKKLKRRSSKSSSAAVEDVPLANAKEWDDDEVESDMTNPQQILKKKHKGRPTKATASTTKKLDWYDSMAQLKVFHAKFGSANVPKGCQEFPELDRWVENIRRSKTLSRDQRAQLQALGFAFQGPNLQRFSRHWDDLLERLKQYKSLHGDTLVPSDYAIDKSLGNWVKNQRAQRRKGRLSKERQAKLEAIGFVWRVKRAQTKVPEKSPKMGFLWHQKYQHLVQFRQQTGHCRVPVIYPENQALGGWVNNQRIAFVEGRMRHDRKQLLDDISFSWKLYKKRTKF